MCAAVAWWVMNLVAADKSRAVERLDELKNPRARGGASSEPERASERMTRVLEKASPALAKPLQPKNEMELGKLRGRLTAAGFRGETAESIFLGLKVRRSASRPVSWRRHNPRTRWSEPGHPDGSGGLRRVLLLPAGTCRSAYGKVRRNGIFLGLPDALDLMVVCVEAGLGLDQAMRKVSEEMEGSYPIIAEEFGIANFQLQMGRTRSDVLHELGARTGVADLRSLAAVLIQADKFGSSIAQALRVQSDSMRTRRPSTCRGESGEDGRETDHPPGDLYLPRYLRGPRWAGCGQWFASSSRC